MNSTNITIHEGVATFDDGTAVSATVAQIKALPALLLALQEIAQRGPIPGYSLPGALLLRLTTTQSIAREALYEAAPLPKS